MLGMRKSAGVAAAALVALLLPGAGAGPALAAPAEFKPLRWDVAGIGASGRTLRLTYQSAGGCNGTFLGTQSRVGESATAVTIELFDVIDVPPPDTPRLPCPAVLPAPRPVYVTLSAPLAGRSIKGRIPWPGSTVPIGPPTYPPSQPEALIRVPRVVGFSVWEARRIIWRSGLNVQIRRSRRPVARTQVVAQAPSGPLRPQQVVRLHAAIPR
ncbi:MAG TPA: hypothetical protein VGV67_09215 [Solirubrobacteraceae bacterium]|nr:hypothetical protein [Solirubrobacteraceae bacterium]